MLNIKNDKKEFSSSAVQKALLDISESYYFGYHYSVLVCVFIHGCFWCFRLLLCSLRLRVST